MAQEQACTRMRGGLSAGHLRRGAGRAARAGAPAAAVAPARPQTGGAPGPRRPPAPRELSARLCMRAQSPTRMHALAARDSSRLHPACMCELFQSAWGRATRRQGRRPPRRARQRRAARRRRRRRRPRRPPRAARRGPRAAASAPAPARRHGQPARSAPALLPSPVHTAARRRAGAQPGAARRAQHLAARTLRRTLMCTLHVRQSHAHADSAPVSVLQGTQLAQRVTAIAALRASAGPSGCG